MQDSKMLIAIVAVAVMALVGRIIINQNKKGDNIKWGKLLSIFFALCAFVITFILFNPHRALQWYKGEATQAEAKTSCIAGRKAAADIPRFASSADEQRGLYYVLQVKQMTPTGYYRTKMPYGSAETERNVEETESEHTVIKRTTSRFPITRNPGDNEQLYMPIYLAHLINNGSVLVAIEQDDVTENGELPVAMLRLTDEKLSDIALSADSTAIANYYFVAFDDVRFGNNTTNYLIYKAIAGLIVAILIALGYLIWARVRNK